MEITDKDEIRQEDLARFFELSFDPMCVLNADGQLVIANAAFGKILGDRELILPGELIFAFIHSDDLDTLSAILTKVDKNRARQTVAFRLMSADSNYKWFLWRIYPGTKKLLYCVAKDITPFQQLENIEIVRSQFAEALLDTVLAINNSNLDLDSVLQRIISNIIKVVSFNHVDIMLIEEGVAFIAAKQDFEESLVPGNDTENLRLVVKEQYYLYQMASTKRPVIIYDLANDKNWTLIPGKNIQGSYLGCPVIVEDEVIAFINVINFQENFYTTIHAQQLLTFANHIAIAIKNTNLFKQAKTVAALRERQHLARELHDSVNQTLFAAGTFTKLIPKVINKSPPKALEYVDKIGQRIRDALAQMRTILVELQPENLINTNLNVLIKQLCDASTGNTNTPIEFSSTAGILLYEDAQIAYYRIAQEALHNIEKHANASKIRINLYEDGNIIALIIDDDGCGFDLNDIALSGFGLNNMYDRAEAIGASLKIESIIGKGTRIILEGKFNDKH